LTSGGGFQTVFAANGQFYVMYYVNSFDPSSPYGYGNSGQLVFRSSDGATWEQVGELTSSSQELVGVMPDGTLVARSYAATGLSGISTSADGVNWILHDLSPLIEPSDGEIVVIDLRVVTVGEQGITASGAVINDEIAEEGGRSIERDGVRLEVKSSFDGQVRAFEAETGDEIPEQNLRYTNLGALDVLADDGSVLASFTSVEWQQLVIYRELQPFTYVLLHSDDGVHWSRENLAELAGLPDAYPGFFQHQDGRVLLNVFEPSQPTDASATSVPLTIVLVGTRK
jgi:hypothetical protein